MLVHNDNMTTNTAVSCKGLTTSTRQMMKDQPCRDPHSLLLVSSRGTAMQYTHIMKVN